jgi:hypothetical protein
MLAGSRPSVGVDLASSLRGVSPSEGWGVEAGFLVLESPTSYYYYELLLMELSIRKVGFFTFVEITEKFSEYSARSVRLTRAKRRRYPEEKPV